MNSTSIQSTAAPIVAFLAGLLAGKGVFGFDIATWTTIIGGLLGLGAAIWAAVATRKTAQIASVAAMPEVQSIKLDPTAAASIVAATPANVNK